VRTRLIAALAYAGAAFLFGIALGERGELGFVQSIFTAVIPIATIVLLSVAREGHVEVVLTGLAMSLGLFLGQHAFSRAWVECLREAPAVRKAIVEHRASTDDYPARLEDLPIELPCDCILRDTILHYLSNDRAFRLWITNDAETVTFTASGRSSNRPRTTPPPRP
jgi:hypothetical protein